ncbi:mrps-7 [Pristionchus pacificus]|uniref:Small ribosomal subunit protein uS7m n=1 Tax=Pristionchus pacificus TaxID=54126 RepID=A0A454XNZ2_PRIPA|nr:mrps-7 [Pristionchus pacificus]|eukprot:PDM75217.1 mrps-7 [Pristionchus pacificus]
MIIRPCARLISTSAPSSSRYDAKVFREPISDREQLRKPLSADDERNFLFIKALKSDETPTFYRNHVVDKLVRVCMTDGRKEMSRKNVLAALEIIKRKQYQAWNKASDDEKPKIELSAFKIAEVGIDNCKPLMKLQGVTRGGTTYQVPFPIEDSEAEFRAMKMMRDICRQKAKHGETFFKDALAAELMLASQNEGATIQAKQELHKTCEANRAYAHYRG